MKINITIPIEEHNNLKSHSNMLGRIDGVVSRYARTPVTTTYECVVKLNERERKLTDTLRALKETNAQLKRELHEALERADTMFAKHADILDQARTGIRYLLNLNSERALSPPQSKP